MSPSVSVSVPATTANLGPGFDCLGAALTLYNQFDFTVVNGDGPAVTIQAVGLGADRVPEAADNLVYTSFLHLYTHLNQSPPKIAIKIELNVPLSRGLGSSATAIIGGLVGANAIAGSPLTKPQILDLAIALEGHPDNVAPALLGNCQLAVQQDNGSTLLCPIDWAPNLVPVVAIPNFELSTHKARTILPKDCSYADAIFNASHLTLLIKGLESGRADWLQAALSDRLHQPFRTPLIPGYEAVKQAALDAGAFGLVISGAGPTLLTFTDRDRADQVALAMNQAWKQEGIMPDVLTLQIDPHGTQVSP